MNLFSLKNKTALVTGALGLIGKKYCEALASAGANVVVADIDVSKAIEFAKLLDEKYAHGETKAMGIGLNVTNEIFLKSARDRILSRFETIDVLVNNAAINEIENPLMNKDLAAFENYPLDAFRKSLEVNVTGVFLCCQIFGTVMAKQGSGSIINIASTYGVVAPDQRIYKNTNSSQNCFNSAAFPVTKGAVLSFTRFLAAYWGKNGVRVNTISPSEVENTQDEEFIQNYSARTLLGRMAKADDYQGALLFLASDASAYMTGANLIVDGGWTAI